MRAKIFQLYASDPKKIKTLTDVTSSIQKSAKTHLNIKANHIINDGCYDLKHHGGSDRVVHFYPRQHYDFIQKKFPKLKIHNCFGYYGENISIEGMDETSVSIGDQYQINDVTLEITEPRNPCHTIDISFETKGVLKLVYQTNKIGWFARVIKEGIISKNDSIKLIGQQNPKMTIDYVFTKVVKERGKDIKSIQEIYEINKLSARYRSACLEILQK